MERLTKKIGNDKYASNLKGGLSAIDCFQKLGQIEDIEEELGIDLITLFKALKEEIYVINENKIIAFSKLEVGYPTLLFSKHLNKWIIWGAWEDEEDVKEYVFNVKDYGKTWALTKEELEKCNDIYRF